MTKEKLQEIKDKDMPTAEDVALLIADNARLEDLVKELQDDRQDVEVAIYGRRYWPSHEEFLEDIEKLKRGEFYKKSYVAELKREKSSRTQK